MPGLRQTYLLAGAGLLAAITPAHAADNAMKVCGARYQTAKTAHTLPAGQTWAQFLAQCRSGLGGARPAAAHTAAAAPKPTASPGLLSRMMDKLTGAAPATHAASGGAAAAHERQRQCGQQWKAAKAAGQLPAGQTWPRYWSQCNARLKG